MSWWRATFTSSLTKNLSSKRQIAFYSAIVLLLSALGLSTADIYRIWTTGDVGRGAATVTICLFGIIAGFAGLVYCKPEVKPMDNDEVKK